MTGGDVREWAQGIVGGLLADHGTLAARHAAYVAEKARLEQERHDAVQAQLERNRVATGAWITRRPDPDTRRE